MQLFVLLITLLHWVIPVQWETDMERAQKNAREQHKAILLNFSGSDWCAPCIKMHKDIFESASFSAWANQYLIMVNADFPREKKRQLPAAIQQQNNRLADTYNAQGIFPLTVLINENGKVIASWEGNPKLSPEAFIHEIAIKLSLPEKINTL